MHLGRKIKELRKQKNISQETLANYLGISFQAISKWETEATMPDVMLIPAIASFFGVSTDELFEFNLFEANKSVEDIVDEHCKYRDDPVKCESILRDGLKKHPGNDILLNCLVNILPTPERAEEVIELCKSLTQATRYDEVKYDAYRIMAEAYYSTGEIALAKNAIEHIPEIYFTKLEIAAILLDGEDKFQAAAKQRCLSFETLIAMCKKLAEYYEENGDNKKAIIQLTMAKNIILSAKDDFPTPYTRSLYEAYDDRLPIIESELQRLAN